MTVHFIFAVSETGSFSGNNYIQYEIKRTFARPLRQASTLVYTTAQNELRLSLATARPSGTVLQFGDPVSTMEYLMVEVCHLHKNK